MRRSYALSVQGWPRIRVGGRGRVSDRMFQVGGRAAASAGAEETHTPRGTPSGRAQVVGEDGQREGGRRL